MNENTYPKSALGDIALERVRSAVSMVPGSDHEKVAELYRQKAEAGLVDVKFLVGNPTEAVTEQVCGEVLRLEAALTKGDCFPLIFDDRH